MESINRFNEQDGPAYGAVVLFPRERLPGFYERMVNGGDRADIRLKLELYFNRLYDGEIVEFWREEDAWAALIRHPALPPTAPGAVYQRVFVNELFDVWNYDDESVGTERPPAMQGLPTKWPLRLLSEIQVWPQPVHSEPASLYELGLGGEHVTVFWQGVCVFDSREVELRDGQVFRQCQPPELQDFKAKPSHMMIHLPAELSKLDPRIFWDGEAFVTASGAVIDSGRIVIPPAAAQSAGDTVQVELNAVQPACEPVRVPPYILWRGKPLLTASGKQATLADIEVPEASRVEYSPPAPPAGGEAYQLALFAWAAKRSPIVAACASRKDLDDHDQKLMAIGLLAKENERLKSELLEHRPAMIVCNEEQQVWPEPRRHLGPAHVHVLDRSLGDHVVEWDGVRVFDSREVEVRDGKVFRQCQPPELRDFKRHQSYMTIPPAMALAAGDAVAGSPDQNIFWDGEAFRSASGEVIASGRIEVPQALRLGCSQPSLAKSAPGTDWSLLNNHHYEINCYLVEFHQSDFPALAICDEKDREAWLSEQCGQQVTTSWAESFETGQRVIVRAHCRRFPPVAPGDSLQRINARALAEMCSTSEPPRTSDPAPPGELPDSTDEEGQSWRDRGSLL